MRGFKIRNKIRGFLICHITYMFHMYTRTSRLEVAEDAYREVLVVGVVAAEAVQEGVQRVPHLLLTQQHKLLYHSYCEYCIIYIYIL